MEGKKKVEKVRGLEIKDFLDSAKDDLLVSLLVGYAGEKITEKFEIEELWAKEV